MRAASIVVHFVQIHVDADTEEARVSPMDDIRWLALWWRRTFCKCSPYATDQDCVDAEFELVKGAISNDSSWVNSALGGNPIA